MGRKKRAKSNGKQTTTRSSLIQTFNRRLDRLRPRSSEEELPEDVAVFDVETRAKLPAELAEQVTAVAEALELVAKSFDEQATARVSSIPRSSSMSQWRLFIRGLIDWYQEDFESAHKAWERLEVSRRPHRIASTLQAAQPGKTLVQDDNTHSANIELIRATRFDRPAIAEAKKNLLSLQKAKASDGIEIHLTEVTMSWVRGFRADYRRLEPALTQAIESAAISRAASQPYVEVFESAIRAVAGPRHDPNHTLLQSQYHSHFEGGEKQSERLLTRYLEKELPKNDQISPALKAALQSEGWLMKARELQKPEEFIGIRRRFFDRTEGSAAINGYFEKATNACPTNIAAHREHYQWVLSFAEDDDLAAANKRWFTNKIPGIMNRWSRGLPDDPEPRLWLVDYLLENENLTEAEPHVQWLQNARQDDPRIRATPWKWQLLEAMRLCRRKAWLEKVPEQLEVAERLWPEWLSRDWLPYLWAAYYLRCGDEETYQQKRAAIQKADTERRRPLGPLVDAVMMLGAAQRMRVPATDLKALRLPVDKAAAEPESIDTKDLIAAGAFYWDLYRTALLYPAYRMHGGKLGRELLKRWKSERLPLTDPLFQSALLWTSEHNFWFDRYTPPPEYLAAASDESIFITAAIVNGRLTKRHPFGDRHLSESSISELREAAATESDRYYRFWFTKLANAAQEERARLSSSQNFGGMSDVFARLFEQMTGDQEDGDDYYDDDDDDDDYDQWGATKGCDCTRCMLIRAGIISADDDYDDYDDDDYDDDDDDDVDAEFRTRFAETIPTEPEPQRMSFRERLEKPVDPEVRKRRPKNPMAKRKKKG